MWGLLGNTLKPFLGVKVPQSARYKPLPPAPPTPPPPIPATPLPALDSALQRLDANKQAWTQVTCRERAQMLRECARKVPELARSLSEVSTAAKGAGGAGLGDEWTLLTSCVGGLQEYAETMDAEAQPHVPVSVRPSTGQLVAQVFPRGLYCALFPGVSGDVWIQKGKPATQGAVYRAKKEGKGGQGSVSLVLGAGNQIAVAFLDVLYKLIADDEVTILKMSPVNEYAGPYIEKIMAPFVERGYLAVVYGGIEVSKHLTTHPLVSSIHLTGSRATYEAILATPGVKSKHVTAELGNVTPYIIVPGQWSDDDIEFHAQSVAGGLVGNNGHNCIALELLITAEDWPQRPAFLAAVRRAINKIPHKVPYYPGAAAKYDHFRQKFAGKVQELGAPVSDVPGMQEAKPWLLVEGLKPEEASVQEENWSGVMQEISIPGTGMDPSSFMNAATKFVNERCFGSLAVGVFIHPETQKDNQEAFTRMIDELQYGSISVNVPGGIAFCFPSFPWGALQANTKKAHESGVGCVHNSLLLDHPEKWVLTVPWRVAPKPLWHADNLALQPVAEQLVNCLASLGNLPLTMYYLTRTAVAAMRG